VPGEVLGQVIGVLVIRGADDEENPASSIAFRLFAESIPASTPTTMPVIDGPPLLPAKTGKPVVQ
jgi:hypothetical protein